MKYKIVHGDDEDQLTKQVNEAIGEGWVPQGGVVVLINTFSKAYLTIEGSQIDVWEPYYNEWHQAMVKPSTNPPQSDRELGW